MLNRSSIEEANKHLQALYSRVSELESIVQEQHNALSAKDSFIQTKIRELSQQDLTIKDLKDKLEEKDKDLGKSNEMIDNLQREVSARNAQVAVLKQKSTALGDLLNLIPDLKSYCSKVDTVAAKVIEIDNGYVEVTESPCLSDEADNTDGGDVTSYAKVSGDAYENFAEESTSVREMARNFVQLEGTKKFSVTEDDLEDGETNLSKNDSTTKELYF